LSFLIWITPLYRRGVPCLQGRSGRHVRRAATRGLCGIDPWRSAYRTRGDRLDRDEHRKRPDERTLALLSRAARKVAAREANVEIDKERRLQQLAHGRSLSYEIVLEPGR